MTSLILQSLDHCGLNVEKNLFVLFKLSQLKQVSLLLWSFRLLSQKVKSKNGSELGKFSQGGDSAKKGSSRTGNDARPQTSEKDLFLIAQLGQLRPQWFRNVGNSFVPLPNWLWLLVPRAARVLQPSVRALIYALSHSYVYSPAVSHICSNQPGVNRIKPEYDNVSRGAIFF